MLAGVLALIAAPAIAVAQTAPAERPAAAGPYAAFVAEAEQRFGVPAAWIGAVLRAESAGDANAVSSAGAMGLMQVMPDTWAELRGRHRLGRDPFDPRDNILASTAYLRELFDRYGTVAAMLAAYHAGPGRYDEYLSTGRALPAETRAYVAALAPVLGGDLPADMTAAAPKPPDWREAPLFVAQSDGIRPADSVPSGAARAAVPAHDPAAIVPQTGNLFVVPASTGASQ